MAGGHTSSREMSGGSGRNGYQGMIKRSFVGFFLFEHDWKSELMGLNQRRRMPWLIVEGLVWHQ